MPIRGGVGSNALQPQRQSQRSRLRSWAAHLRPAEACRRRAAGSAQPIAAQFGPPPVTNLLFHLRASPPVCGRRVRPFTLDRPPERSCARPAPWTPIFKPLFTMTPFRLPAPALLLVAAAAALALAPVPAAAHGFLSEPPSRPFWTNWRYWCVGCSGWLHLEDGLACQPSHFPARLRRSPAGAPPAPLAQPRPPGGAYFGLGLGT